MTDATSIKSSLVSHKLSDYEQSTVETSVPRIGFNLFTTSYNAENHICFLWSYAHGYQSSQTGELLILASVRLFISTAVNDGSFPVAEPLLLWLEWRSATDLQSFFKFPGQLPNSILIHRRTEGLTCIPSSKDLAVASFTLLRWFLWLNKGPRLDTHAQTMPRSTSRNETTRVFTSTTKHNQSKAFQLDTRMDQSFTSYIRIGSDPDHVYYSCDACGHSTARA